MVNIVLPRVIVCTPPEKDGFATLLVLSQVVLTAQLPFALYPLIRFTGDRSLMGAFANGVALRLCAWTIFAAVTLANIWLVWGLAT